ncbi:uncharacterized protein LOC123528478 [Mercenaria mercenaria]|uniref:uncharacterized protein LOC123528478 n=1 Tax=Mercenaria mercenaria TaxID=6596 RepID=UPI00234ED961|nr:uncharacterized protein LOC123528478 [Mercenaria mercenaria]XP_045164168.2 uncharacterized protein LOC123528478 [Mercenaria mercenaria]
MANVCLKMCNSMYQIPTRILCLVLLLLQGVVLDYYLVKHKNKYWASWIVADIAVIVVFVTAFIISYRHLQVAKDAVVKNTPVQTGALPLGYLAWFVYSGFLATRVAIIFKDFAFQLKEEDFFGPNTLKINISLAAFVFMLLLLCHHDAEVDSERKHVIVELTGTVVFDVLDSVDVLDILFDKEAIEDFTAHMDTAIIVIACINLVLPTLPLMTLSRMHYGHRRAPREISMLHKLLLVFLVNLPLLIIRLLLWHLLSKDISIFPMKNVVVIFLVFHDLYEKRREELDREEMMEVDGEATELNEVNSQ